MLFGNFETEGPHSVSHEVSLPIALKAPQTVSTTLSRTGTPNFSSTSRAIPAPDKLVHKITTASAPSLITSSDALTMSCSETSAKLKLSVKSKCRSEIHSNFFKLKFLIIFSCIDPTFVVTNPIFVIFSDQRASKMDREAVTA